MEIDIFGGERGLVDHRGACWMHVVGVRSASGGRGGGADTVNSGQLGFEAKG